MNRLELNECVNKIEKYFDNSYDPLIGDTIDGFEQLQKHYETAKIKRIIAYREDNVFIAAERINTKMGLNTGQCVFIVGHINQNPGGAITYKDPSGNPIVVETKPKELIPSPAQFGMKAWNWGGNELGFKKAIEKFEELTKQ